MPITLLKSFIVNCGGYYKHVIFKNIKNLNAK
jgi:hypothetical protein